MGRVYRARMKGPADASKDVAIKVMHAHLAEDKDFVLMFLDEMRVAMALNHRNIVHTFDAGRSDEDYFMVMELVEGCSLRQLLAAIARSGQRLPIDIAVFIGMEISAALDYAHRPLADARRAGVLHRDVSPSNILLSAEGDVKLTDFGVAKAAGGRFVTSANLVRGKLQYMSPEQAEGEARPQSDLFSLGAVLYEILTAQPIPRPSAFHGLRHSTLPPAPRSIRADVPEILDALILHCLEPDVAHRISSASALRSALTAAAFELQQRPDMDVDPHARLRRFLSDHAPAKKESTQAPAKKTSTHAPTKDPPTTEAIVVENAAAQLAQAVLQQVRAIETNPEIQPSASVDDDDAKTWIAPGPPLTNMETQLSATQTGETVLDGPSSAQMLPPPAKRTSRRGLLVLALGLVLVLGALVVMSSSGGKNTERGPSPTPPTRTPSVGIASGNADADRRSPDMMVASPDAATERQAMSVVVMRKAMDSGAPRPKKRVRVTPRRSPRYGMLDINSVPWTRVFIDGRFRGETPLERIRLRAGRHKVRLVSRSRKGSWTYSVRVLANQRRSRVFKLPPK